MIKRKQIIESIAAHEGNTMRNVFSLKNEHQRKVFSKIISDYLEHMWDAVLDGNSWWLPSSFGRIMIVAEQQKHLNRIPFYKKHLLKGHEYDTNDRAFNGKAMDKIFSIVIKGGYLEKKKCRFRAAPSIRRRL